MSESTPQVVTVYPGRLTLIPEWYEARLKDLLALKENWDDHGAPPINPEHVESARRLLAMLDPRAPRPLIFPTVDSGVRLEWHVDVHGFDLEIVIDGR